MFFKPGTNEPVDELEVFSDYVTTIIEDHLNGEQPCEEFIEFLKLTFLALQLCGATLLSKTSLRRIHSTAFFDEHAPAILNNTYADIIRDFLAVRYQFGLKEL